MTATEARILIACEQAWNDKRWTLHIYTPQYQKYATSHIF